MGDVNRLKEDRHIYDWISEGITTDLEDPIDKENYNAILNICIARLMLTDATEALEFVSRFPTIEQIFGYGYNPEIFQYAFNITIAEVINRINQLRINALQLQRNCNKVLNISYIILMILAPTSTFSEHIPAADFMTFARAVTNNNVQDPDILLNKLFRGLDGYFRIHDEDISTIITAVNNNQMNVVLNEITDVLKLPYSASIDLDMNYNDKLNMIQREAFRVDSRRLYRPYADMRASFVDLNEIRNLTNPQVLIDNAPNKIMYPYEHYFEAEYI